MTLIPKQEKKKCFKACDDDRIKSGLCDCHNAVINSLIPGIEICQIEDNKKSLDISLKSKS